MIWELYRIGMGITCQSDGNYMAIQCEWEIYGIDMGIMCQSLKIIWQFNVNGMGIVWVSYGNYVWQFNVNDMGSIWD